jgi:hypothetical protein
MSAKEECMGCGCKSATLYCDKCTKPARRDPYADDLFATGQKHNGVKIECRDRHNPKLGPKASQSRTTQVGKEYPL